MFGENYAILRLFGPSPGDLIGILLYPERVA